jgi:phosphoglycerate dehydrogenase-like enzyme
MKIIILTPNKNTLFNSSQLESIEKAGEVEFITEIQDFSKVKSLFEGTEDRIVAIDPDFCGWKVPNEVIEKIPNLKAIVLQTTSFSWIDVDFAKTKDIPVINLRGFSSIAVAEWATMMMINLARKIPLVIKDSWKQDYVKHQGIELRGKTVGIIGLGNIGTAIAENCDGLGMNVQYWSKNSTDDRFEKVDLEALMESSDVVIPAVAQNEETKGMITDYMLKSMKKSAMFVSDIHNVYNHDLILQMVADGNLYGYGFEDKKVNMSDFKGNVWAGPSLAWCTEDSMRKNGQQWMETIINASIGDYTNRIN